VVVVEQMLFVEMSRELECIGDPGFPVTLANTANNAVDKLLDRTGPASAPCHSTSLALSFVSTQLVDAHTLGQPQSSRERDVLVETLFKQHFAGEAVGYGATEPTKACGWVRQVVQPLLTGGVSQRQSRRRLEGVGGLEAAGLLSLLEHGDEQGRQGAKARFVLEVVYERRACGVGLVHNLRFVTNTCLD
jgi:hypothetical protein